MKILFVHDYPPIEGGGLEVNTFTVARELVCRGNQVTIATTRCSSESYQGTVVSTREGVSIVLIKDVNEIASLVKNCDVVCPQMTFSLRAGGLEAIVQGIRQRKQVVVTQHTSTSHIPYSALKNLTKTMREELLQKYLELLNNTSLAVVVPSLELQKDMYQFGVEREIRVVPVGIDVPDLLDVDKRYDVVTVGEVSYLKGVNYLFDAIRLLNKEDNEISAVIVGNGSEFDLVKALAENLGLQNQVDFLGYVPHDQVFQLFAQSKVMVHSSLSEVMPLVVIEAQMAGIPVVASDVGTNKSLLEKSGGGVVYERGDAPQLAMRLQFLLSNWQLRETMGRLGREYCVRTFSVERQVDRFSEILVDTLRN